MQSDKRASERLQKIWGEIRKDPEGARALAVLKRAGFDFLKIPAEPYTWPGIIASIPSLPDRPARSRRLPSLPSARPVIAFVRELARMLQTPSCSVEAHDSRARAVYMGAPKGMTPRQFEEAADILERIFSFRWAVTEHNPQQNSIAVLRWEIRQRTGRAHDLEIAQLIGAAFRATGQDSFHMDVDTLKKVETRERKTRIAGRKKLIGPDFRF